MLFDVSEAFNKAIEILTNSDTREVFSELSVDPDSVIAFSRLADHYKIPDRLALGVFIGLLLGKTMNEMESFNSELEQLNETEEEKP